MALVLLAVLSCTAFAAPKDLSRTVGVVLVGGAEFKTEDYLNITKDEIKSRCSGRCEIGNDVQSKYNAYCLEHGQTAGKEAPSKQDVMGFASWSGYGKVLFLVVSDSVVDRHQNAKSRERDRVSVQVDGYLGSSLGILQVYTACHDEDSKTSNLRARRGAFRSCVEEIGKKIRRNL